MNIPLSLLLIFIGSTSAKKSGDFGIASACLTKNKSLRLDCYYEACPGSPHFDCELMTPEGSLVVKASGEMCKHILPEYPLNQHIKTLTYNCTLIRKKRKEKKTIVITNPIKTCSATTGLLLHRAPTLLWPVAILSLWRVLITDGETT